MKNVLSRPGVLACLLALSPHERVQITHNAVQTGRDDGGCNLTDALEIRLDFKHGKTGDYQRGLDLEPGLVWIDYGADRMRCSWRPWRGDGTR